MKAFNLASTTPARLAAIHLRFSTNTNSLLRNNTTPKLHSIPCINHIHTYSIPKRQASRPQRYHHHHHLVVNQSPTMSSLSAPRATARSEHGMNLYEFFRGRRYPNTDLQIDDIIDWTDDKLERRHDFVQYVFPLPEQSQFNRDAPALDEATYRAIYNDDAAIIKLRTMWQRMMIFYGFEMCGPVDDDGNCSWRIRRGKELEASLRRWARSSNHNHLRITRILRCLRLFRLNLELGTMYNLLRETSNRYPIGVVSLGYWHAAVSDSIWKNPSGTNCDWLEAMDWPRDMLPEGVN
jgi:hypothetical protein